jgi:AraC family transcriptional regulator
MDHLAQIQKAVDYIEDHLNDELSLESVARIAGFSKWHFQKIFSASVGDSLKEYIRLRRLTKAMNELVATDKRILDISLAAGFESQEAFTRAFRVMYTMTPGEARKSGNPFNFKKLRITMEYLDHLYGGINMEPIFKKMHEMKIIGCAGKFISITSPDKNNMEIIPKLWQKYMPRRHEIKNSKSSSNLGACFELPSDGDDHSDECFYIAGTEVENFDSIPAGMEGLTVSAGEYAIFTHKGKLDTFEHTMNYIFGSWLPKSGKKLRNSPTIDFYDHRFKLNQDDSELDVWIPIE